MNKRVVFRPVGYVYNNVPGPRYHNWGDVISDIVVDEDLAPALDGIEDYSHIMILFYLSGITRRQRQTLKVRPGNRQDMPEVGVFATRTQFRCNPIGVTVVRLLERQGNRLRVSGLDTYNGAPILDIKGYMPEPDLAEDARVPEWARRLREHRKPESAEAAGDGGR